MKRVEIIVLETSFFLLKHSLCNVICYFNNTGATLKDCRWMQKKANAIVRLVMTTGADQMFSILLV